jgi:hypothetical protein
VRPRGGGEINLFCPPRNSLSVCMEKKNRRALSGSMLENTFIECLNYNQLYRLRRITISFGGFWRRTETVKINTKNMKNYMTTLQSCDIHYIMYDNRPVCYYNIL